jgi:predicted TIM-barrel fold metal-dependent hydrolase
MVPDLSKTAVDSHFHVFDAHQAQPGARYTPPMPRPWQHGRPPPGPLGVRRGVLVQTSFLGTDNRLLLSTLRSTPRRCAASPWWRPPPTRTRWRDCTLRACAASG